MSSKECLKLGDWISHEKRLLKKFANWWEQQQRKDDEQFPYEMWGGDWDEQYEFFKQQLSASDIVE